LSFTLKENTISNLFAIACCRNTYQQGSKLLQTVKPRKNGHVSNARYLCIHLNSLAALIMHIERLHVSNDISQCVQISLVCTYELSNILTMIINQAHTLIVVL